MTQGWRETWMAGYHTVIAWKRRVLLPTGPAWTALMITGAHLWLPGARYGCHSPSQHCSWPGNRCCSLSEEPVVDSRNPGRSCCHPQWKGQALAGFQGAAQQQSNMVIPHWEPSGRWWGFGSIPWHLSLASFGAGAAPQQRSGRH